VSKLSAKEYQKKLYTREQIRRYYLNRTEEQRKRYNETTLKKAKIKRKLYRLKYPRLPQIAWNKGKKMSDKAKLNMSLAHTGKSKKYKDGIWLDRKYLWVVTRIGAMLLHKSIMEDMLERKLKKGEIVHHINGNRLDNRKENLQLFSSNGEHTKYHWDKRRGNKSYFNISTYKWKGRKAYEQKCRDRKKQESCL